ncbi:MAG: HAMP domain-containing histidine kinase, partial [Clostridia bacterium]|nr:HAMP domain-containing histidine kinase [Clostridia bacterium]
TQNAAVVGKLASLYPGHENDLALALIETPSDKEIQIGFSILSHFGYKVTTPLNQNPFFSTGIQVVVAAGVLFILFFWLLTAFLVSKNHRRIYQKLDYISRCAERIVDGDFGISLDSVGEGSFAILGHHFNQMANRLKNTVESLKAEKTFLKDIIADISHQLKTPLATLIINVDILLNDPDMNPATRISFLETCNQQLTRLEWLILSLLKMARLESGSIAFKKEEIPLDQPLKEAMQTLATMAKEAQVTLKINETESPVTCHGDREWLQEAFVNIIKNCIEHCPQEGVVQASFFETPMTSGITIWDNGEGIDKKDLPHIFKRFYKGSSKKPASVGIGLSLSKAIIEGHDASIVARSEKGKGTEFTITFLKGA